MKIAIIGAGWYGCHIACSLIKRSMNVTVFDKSTSIFSQASAKNQNRLHLGFHYPRSHTTREQSQNGFGRFIDTYGFLCKKINKNIYAVDDNYSLIDYATYKAIMTSAKLEFSEIHEELTMLRNLTGSINTNEQIIDFKQAGRYFTETLSSNLLLCSEINKSDIIKTKQKVQIFGQNYDYLINCTWGTFNPTFKNIFYEPCITLLYASEEKNFALTIMDGQFISILPYEENLYTLTSVRNTPLRSI